MMDAIDQKMRQVQKAFADAPVFVRPYLLPVLELLELLVLELKNERGSHG